LGPKTKPIINRETTPGGEGTDLCLIIKVSYEFLPEINEELLLKRQKLSD
jgi:hypothetical protein